MSSLIFFASQREQLLLCLGQPGSVTEHERNHQADIPSEPLCI
ncbi:MAG: hypothetical protein R3311_01480 [Oceanisphaera sp.]|nr:hypothetical protein [Oceanisphaera sp.]